MKHSVISNLRLIAEYVYYQDAPALLGIPRATLTRYVKGAKPNAQNEARIARVASKFRRRQSQVARYEREQAEREFRRKSRVDEQLDRARWRESLDAHGIDLPLPYRIPRLLRVHKAGMEGSPVYIYDLRPLVTAIESYRQITEDALFNWQRIGKKTKAITIVLNYFQPSRDTLEAWREEGIPNPLSDLILFYDTMRQILPMGQAFLTYEVCPGGTTEQGGKVTEDETNLRLQDDGCYVFSTKYWQFWKSKPRGIDEIIVKSSSEFVRFFDNINDHSVKRYVIEIGVTYPAITKWRPQDLERFEREGLNKVWGVKIYYE